MVNNFLGRWLQYLYLFYSHKRFEPQVLFGGRSAPFINMLHRHALSHRDDHIIRNKLRILRRRKRIEKNRRIEHTAHVLFYGVSKKVCGETGR